MAIDNPTPEQMTNMIQAIFAKTDDLLNKNDLPPPGDLMGFTELLRLVFNDDDAGRAIFNSFDEATNSSKMLKKKKYHTVVATPI